MEYIQHGYLGILLFLLLGSLFALLASSSGAIFV